MNAQLIFEDGSVFTGSAFGSKTSTVGEVVFNTGMVGYPECLTDPSYAGQILGVDLSTNRKLWCFLLMLTIKGIHAFFESNKVQIAGLVVSECSANFSHWNADVSLDSWLQANHVPGIAGLDTRILTQKLRMHGSMPGKFFIDEEPGDFYDPNQDNLVAKVSIKSPVKYGRGNRHVVVIDCGCKNNIIRSLVDRGLSVTAVPWDWDVAKESCDGVLISNGPGDPKMCDAAVTNVRKLMANDVPVFGICLGSQILALAAGADTYKLKFGHRSQNQPCVLVGSKRCFITSQNHGYAVDENTLPQGWEPWFFNANDGTNEGLRHKNKPFRGVQFHPEATPGPVDTNFLFDEFVEML